MIRYSLVCEAGHGFESWFPSSESYDAQAARGLVTCPVCDTARVEKAVMAPNLARHDLTRHDLARHDLARRDLARREAAPEPPPAPAASDAPAPAAVPMIAEPERRMRAMLRALREHVAATAEHVGPRFPEEARRMHYGEAEHRSIYGQASIEEARALLDEGIDVAPLPPMPDDRN